MNDDQFSLANAYLDGELTVDERATAEADAVVMAAVADLRALRSAVRDVEPPGDTAREAAIAAAMRHFGPAPLAARTHAATAARPPYTRYLALAAGVLGVGLLGLAIANLDTGGDDDQAATEAPADEPAAEPAEEPAEEPADGPAILADDGTAVDRATEQELATADEPALEAAEEPAEEPAAEPAAEPVSGDVAARPVLAPGQVLTTPEELGSFGTQLLEEQRAGTLGPTPNDACPVADVLGRAEYLVAGEVVPILVAVDEPGRRVLGYADETCGLVAEGPLYQP